MSLGRHCEGKPEVTAGDLDAVARAYLNRVVSSNVPASEADVAQALAVLPQLAGKVWNEFGRVLDPSDHDCIWQVLYTCVQDLAQENGQVFWPLFKRMVQLSPQFVLGDLGAGLFETWVDESRLAGRESELAELLANDPRSRQVFESSWDVPPTLARLLERK